MRARRTSGPYLGYIKYFCYCLFIIEHYWRLGIYDTCAVYFVYKLINIYIFLPFMHSLNFFF